MSFFWLIVFKWVQTERLQFKTFCPWRKCSVQLHFARFQSWFFFQNCGSGVRFYSWLFFRNYRGGWLFFFSFRFFDIFFLSFSLGFESSQTSKCDGLMLSSTISTFRCDMSANLTHFHDTTIDSTSIVFEFMRTWTDNALYSFVPALTSTIMNYSYATHTHLTKSSFLVLFNYF